MTIERHEPTGHLDERAMLEGWLDYHRATLAWKCEGLSEEQLKKRSVSASSLSLLGLVRHMAEVEKSWFRIRFAGEDIPHIYFTDDDRDGDFDNLDSHPVDEVFDDWREQCERSREISSASSLDDVVSATSRDPRDVSLRWIMTHMIEEYARHNGHADLLRESIDGATGD